MVSPLTFCTQNMFTVANPMAKSPLNCFARLLFKGRPTRATVQHCQQYMRSKAYVHAGGSKEPLPYMTKYLSSTPFCCNRCEAISGGKTPVTLNLCAKCKSVMYCSRECQVADWKEHKPICRGEKKPLAIEGGYAEGALAVNGTGGSPNKKGKKQKKKKG